MELIECLLDVVRGLGQHRLNRLKELDTKSRETGFAAEKRRACDGRKRADHHHRPAYGGRADIACLGDGIHQDGFERPLAQLARQQADDEILLGACGSPKKLTKAFVASGRCAGALDRRDLCQRVIDINELQFRRLAGRGIPRGPQRRKSNPDAPLTRLAREHADGNFDLVWRKLAQQVGEQADLREAAARLRHGGARLDKLMQQHVAERFDRVP